MEYDAAFLTKTAATPLELRGATDMAIARTLFSGAATFGAWCRDLGIRFGCDLHMTADAGCFVYGLSERYILHEGKTFHQFTDVWDTAPRYSISEAALRGKPRVLEAAQHARLAFRDIARSTDERTTIAAIVPPGTVFGHTATVEKQPNDRPLVHAQLLCAVMNSFCFDWLVRQKAAVHLSLYILDGMPVPLLSPADRAFLAHATAQLSGAPAARWDVRAAADAVVARAYGLNREQYRHILTGFSHRSFPDAPALCLAAFDLHQGADPPCRGKSDTLSPK